MNELRETLQRFEDTLIHWEKLNPSISTSNIGWHIEHSLLTLNKIIYALETSNPSKFKPTFKLSKLIIFTLNKIPKGKVKAPKIVMPMEYDLDSLTNHFQQSLGNVERLARLDSNSFFTHPYFGDLRLKDAIKILKIHTKHHLKIIDNIILS